MAETATGSDTIAVSSPAVSGWRARLLRILRVPPEPAPPPGDTVLRVFRAAPGYYRYQLLTWALTSAGAVLGVVWGFVFATRFAEGFGGWIEFAIKVSEWFAVAGLVGKILLDLAVLRLNFEFRWYILGQRSLRVREGILSLREQTMTYANIQQISVKQNPLERLFGIADVEVRTAGGGGSGGDPKQEHGDMHTAHFRGVADAAHIRDLIRERVRLHRDAGLGDPDDETEAPGDDAVRAAGELLEEVRALRVASSQ